MPWIKVKEKENQCRTGIFNPQFHYMKPTVTIHEVCWALPQQSSRRALVVWTNFCAARVRCCLAHRGFSNINVLAYVLSYANSKSKNQAYCKYPTESICIHSMNLILHKMSVYFVLNHYIGLLR